MLVRVHISCWQQQCFAVVEGSHRETIAVFYKILKPKLHAEGTWNQAIYSSYFVGKGERNESFSVLSINRQTETYPLNAVSEHEGIQLYFISTRICCNMRVN